MIKTEVIECIKEKRFLEIGKAVMEAKTFSFEDLKDTLKEVKEGEDLFETDFEREVLKKKVVSIIKDFFFETRGEAKGLGRNEVEEVESKLSKVRSYLYCITGDKNRRVVGNDEQFERILEEKLGRKVDKDGWISLYLELDDTGLATWDGNPYTYYVLNNITSRARELLKLTRIKVKVKDIMFSSLSNGSLFGKLVMREEVGCIEVVPWRRHLS